MFKWLAKQFEIDWTVKDTVRAIWTFTATFVTVFAGAVAGPLKDFLTKCQEEVCDVGGFKAAGLAAAIAAFPTAFLALKNAVLKDQSALKG